MESNTDNKPKGSGGSEPIVPPRKPSSVAKWQAITVVLILAVAALAVAYALKTPSSSTGPVPSGTATIDSSTYQAGTALGADYTFDMNLTGGFVNATYYFEFGDGTGSSYAPAGFVVNNGVTQLQVSHVYNTPGDYYIYFAAQFSNGAVSDNSQSLIPVATSGANLLTNQTLAYIKANITASSNMLAGNDTNIFSPGDHYTYFLGYLGIDNSSYSVISQTYTTEVTNGLSSSQDSSLSGTVNLSNPLYSVSSAVTGLNQVFVYTTTGNYTKGGAGPAANLSTTAFILDIPVFTGANIAGHIVSTTNVFTSDEVVPAGFKTLDGAIAYDTVSYEVQLNLYLWLVQYNGSSNSSFFPELASALPTTANGGINNNYNNYTESYINGTGGHVTYAVNITPYSNYTFHIRSSAAWQDGTPVTAYDVYYSYIRTLLFDAGAPGTPGWIEAQIMLPGDFYTSNDYYNITNNITYNNATNNITFHFQQAESPTFVFQILASSGDFIMDSSWMIAHGAGITFTEQGFNNYKKQGSATDYNTYLQYHAFADGPYEVNYIVPGQEVVLSANPAFVSPGAWYPAPLETTVNIVYVAEYQTAVLDLTSKHAQAAAGIPTTTWGTVQNLQSKSIINIYPTSTLNIYWFNFNALVDTSVMKAQYPGSNLPANLFTSLQIRNVFAYSFDYAYYINYLSGNLQYNTIFAQSYAGMLPQGMYGYQSIADLNAATNNGVPNFDLAKAQQNWNEFMNTQASSFGITNVSGTPTYGGSALNIPILTFAQDPVDEEAVTTWAYNLSMIMFGTTSNYNNFPVEPTAFDTLLGNEVQGSNPMPVYELGWAPDYPYPTDYLGPMALPINTTTYPGPNDFNPYWFNGNASNNVPNATEANVMKTMIKEYADAQNSSYTAAQQLAFFQQMNENLINMTFYVYLFQAFAQQIVSSSVPSSVMYQDLENTMISPSGYSYNYFYTT